MNSGESNIDGGHKKSRFSKKEEKYHLILYNDEINTFDFVIETLINVMNFHETQAEQLAILAHYRGTMIIKKGNLKELNSYCKRLQDKGLVSEVVIN